MDGKVVLPLIPRLMALNPDKRKLSGLHHLVRVVDLQIVLEEVLLVVRDLLIIPDELLYGHTSHHRLL